MKRYRIKDVSRISGLECRRGLMKYMSNGRRSFKEYKDVSSICNVKIGKGSSMQIGVLVCGVLYVSNLSVHDFSDSDHRLLWDLANTQKLGYYRALEFMEL
jgi:hypothetical protein